MKGWGKRENAEKTRRPTASSGNSHFRKSVVNRPGIEPVERFGRILANEVLGADKGEMSIAGMQGRGKREIPEKIRRPAASSGTIPTCENPGVTRPGIEPGSPYHRNIYNGVRITRSCSPTSVGSHKFAVCSSDLRTPSRIVAFKLVGHHVLLCAVETFPSVAVSHAPPVAGHRREFSLNAALRRGSWFPEYSYASFQIDCGAANHSPSCQATEKTAWEGGSIEVGQPEPPTPSTLTLDHAYRSPRPPTIDGPKQVSIRRQSETRQKHAVTLERATEKTSRQTCSATTKQNGVTEVGIDGCRAAPERKGGNGRSPRKPADQWHRPARPLRTKIRELPPSGSETGSPRREASSLTTPPPRLPFVHIVTGLELFCTGEPKGIYSVDRLTSYGNDANAGICTVVRSPVDHPLVPEHRTAFVSRHWRSVKWGGNNPNTTAGLFSRLRAAVQRRASNPLRPGNPATPLSTLPTQFSPSPHHAKPLSTRASWPSPQIGSRRPLTKVGGTAAGRGSPPPPANPMKTDPGQLT
ncbi:hypothetical protein PR048_000583 [Dryococelus australis]|uniref:Uncharacterized protein n=1 Tax=Dryococelus australis TaxID=614101 RepID=A0ABQ9IF23_9NEOP|nr:hypothetical protein PR048_000583 [Dryococelus australis]